MTKNILKLSSFVFSLGFTQLSLAADWTPLLQIMQNGCAVHSANDKIAPIMAKIEDVPKYLKADVLHHTTPMESNHENTDQFTLTLKNATAFGYPIQKIIYNDTELKVYFKNTDFMKAISQFTVPVEHQNQPAGIQNAWGTIYKATKDQTTPIDFPKPITQNLDGQTYTSYDFDKLSKKYDVIYITDETGWYLNSETSSQSLKFNSQEKTISCTFEYRAI